VYPFILFGLLLSTLAAIQAPAVMMSHNRKEVRDRSLTHHASAMAVVSRRARESGGESR
jgi:uncharacterized membrane protein